jgi:hypothetical protein
MFQVEGVEDWQGQEVIDREGEKVGRLDVVFTDTEDGAPSLAAVKSGRLVKHTALVPLAGATFARGHVRLPYTKDLIESAPTLDANNRVTRDDELLIARHYGVSPPERDTAGDQVRYEPVGSAEERRAEAAAALDRAAELEAEAERKAAEADSRKSDATQAGQQADEAEAERRRLLEEAARIRSEADPGR